MIIRLKVRRKFVFPARQFVLGSEGAQAVAEFLAAVFAKGLLLIFLRLNEYVKSFFGIRLIKGNADRWQQP